MDRDALFELDLADMKTPPSTQVSFLLPLLYMRIPFSRNLAEYRARKETLTGSVRRSTIQRSNDLHIQSKQSNDRLAQPSHQSEVQKKIHSSELGELKWVSPGHRSSTHSMPMTMYVTTWLDRHRDLSLEHWTPDRQR